MITGEYQNSWFQIYLKMHKIIILHMKYTIKWLNRYNSLHSNSKVLVEFHENTMLKIQYKIYNLLSESLIKLRIRFVVITYMWNQKCFPKKCLFAQYTNKVLSFEKMHVHMMISISFNSKTFSAYWTNSIIIQ